jgi:hypothetical protein
MLIRLALFLVHTLVFFGKQGYAQDLNSAHEVVHTLSTQHMYGRGYLRQGHHLAANYIEDEFKKIGLSSFKTETYQQYFNISINTHPVTPILRLDEISYRVGQDYLFTPGAPSIKKGYEPVKCSIKSINRKTRFGKKYAHRAVFVDMDGQSLSEQGRKNVYKNGLGADVVVLSGVPKLTHRMSQIQNDFCVLEFSKILKSPQKHWILI